MKCCCGCFCLFVQLDEVQALGYHILTIGFFEDELQVAFSTDVVIWWRSHSWSPFESQCWMVRWFIILAIIVDWPLTKFSSVSFIFWYSILLIKFTYLDFQFIHLALPVAHFALSSTHFSTIRKISSANFSNTQFLCVNLFCSFYSSPLEIASTLHVLCSRCSVSGAIELSQGEPLNIVQQLSPADGDLPVSTTVSLHNTVNSTIHNNARAFTGTKRSAFTHKGTWTF